MTDPIWWLSYVDDSDGVDDRFMGVCLVRARDFLDAVKEVHRLCLSPGGQVRGLPVPADMESTYLPHINKLLSKVDLMEAFGDFETTRGDKLSSRRGPAHG